MLLSIVLITQLVVSVITAIYFGSAIKKQRTKKTSAQKDSAYELDRIKKQEAIKLTCPLTELSRPKTLDEIVGQKEGIINLKAVLCGDNPQHVIIYGPPGVGKTAAARAVLECAKKNQDSPFEENAKFIEVDATTVQYDERSIADPLIGSVHDPIYQGAGAYGPAGVPQPKPGAVTKANGGVLFIDEIGELPTVQLNRLLKVLEDRRVFFESSYYASDDPNIPKHIHYAFKNGLPADFRLIGATTRSPEEINPAIRSRCVEIFFDNLSKPELVEIGRRAVSRSGITINESQLSYAAEFAQNGRDMVNIVQMASSVTKSCGRQFVQKKDIQWVADSCRYSKL
ncbi:MAG: AAA family ATPase, partial [Eubacteriales bacterium]|nr:AAA family ATPase [Eubacteriales bacterium]